MKATLSRLWPALPIGLVLSLLLVRWSQHPIEAYGDSAAQLIEHLARLRLLDRLDEGLAGGPLAWLSALDGLYPPGLHLVEAAWGTVVGHAPDRVVLLGLGWWVLLCGAVAALARRLGPPGSAAAAAVGVALIPALQGAALRSYYDLPMTALLWAAVAVLAAPGRARGVVGGLLMLAACLVKWTALPFGAAMLVGLAVPGDAAARRRVGTASVVVGVGVAACIFAGMGSLQSMGGATFQPPPGVTPPDLAVALPDPLGQWLQAAAAQLAVTDAARLWFYPSRLVTSVLSPVGGLAVVAGMVGWLRRGAPGAGLAAATVAGHVVFLLVFVPPLDDRFLLTVAPALALVAAMGLVGHRWVGGLVVVAMLAVAGDAHLRAPVDPVPSVGPGQRAPALEGRKWTPRLGLSSSVDRRGWSRTTDLQHHRGALRSALWDALTACGGGGVDGPDAVLSAGGDLNWWTAERSLARRQGRPFAVFWLGEPADTPPPRRLWIGPVPPSAFGPPTAAPDGWLQRVQVTDPDGGPAVAVWSAPGLDPCG